MNTLQNIIDFLEEAVPLEYQESYDNCGLLVGELSQSVDKVLVCVDITMEVLEEAKENNCNLIVSHHPLIFTPKKNIIKDECWLATDVFVAPGITIGKGTVVGSRSSVYKDIPSNKVCVGNPAKIIRERTID